MARLSLLLLLVLAGVGGPLSAQSKRFLVGDLVRRPIELNDVRGTPHVLVPRVRGERTGTDAVYVLVFWSLRDPLSRRYLPTLERLQRDFQDEAVRLYLIASNHDELTGSAGDPIQRLRDYVEDHEVQIPLLVDHGNRIADRLDALCANHVFVVARNRQVLYWGGIDDDPRGKKAARGQGVREHLRAAIEDLLAGRTPEVDRTSPTGRRIKRAPLPEDE